MKKILAMILTSSAAFAEGKVEFWNDKMASTVPGTPERLTAAMSEGSGYEVDIISYTFMSV